MTDMVERVARLLCKDCYPDMPADWQDEAWPEWVPVARAAIEAMRDPDETMCEAGWPCLPDSIADAYRAMIDAALAPRTGAALRVGVGVGR